MWNMALKTDWYDMLENRCFEAQVILLFANFWNPARIFKKWEKKKKKKPGQVFQNNLIPRPNDYNKN
jgi:hypothetical protein